MKVIKRLMVGLLLASLALVAFTLPVKAASGNNHCSNRLRYSLLLLIKRIKSLMDMILLWLRLFSRSLKI